MLRVLRLGFKRCPLVGLPDYRASSTLARHMVQYPSEPVRYSRDNKVSVVGAYFGVLSLGW